MGYGSKHVRFSAERPLFRGRNQHLRSSGDPKVRYESLEEARDVATIMRADGKDVQPYRCGECLGYHNGNRRHMDKVPDRDIALFTELGDRAYAHMRAQNGRRGTRSRVIANLVRRAIDKQLWGSNNVTPQSHRRR